MHKYLLALVTLTHVSTAATIPFPEFKGGPLNHIVPFFNISTPSCPNPSPDFAAITVEAENFAIRSLVTACLSLKTLGAIPFAVRQAFPILTKDSLSYEVLSIIFEIAHPTQAHTEGLSKRAQQRKREAERQQLALEDRLEHEETVGGRSYKTVAQPKNEQGIKQQQMMQPLLQEVVDHENMLMRISLSEEDNIFAPAAAAAASDYAPINSLKVRVLRFYKELSEKILKVSAQKTLSTSLSTSAASAGSTGVDDFVSLTDFEPQPKAPLPSAVGAAHATTPQDFISLDIFEPRQPGIESKASAIHILTIAWKKQCERLEAHLKENIIGQNYALEGFVWGIYNHYSRLIKETFAESMDSIKANHLGALVRDKHMPSTILIVGPSGTGKTEMFRLAMEFLNLPSGTGSGALMTRAGYIGDKPEYIIEQLFQVAKSQENAEKHGVVFVDELDKMAGSVDSKGGEFTEGAQHTLLTLIEGSQPIKISVKEDGEDQTYHVNTKGMLFVLAGAFADLIPHQRLHSDEPFLITDTALVGYGIRPELINRIHRIIQTHPLSASDFYKILMFKNSPLRQVMREYHEYKGVNVMFEKAALDAFADYSVKQGLGARNLKRQLQGMVDALYLKTSREKGTQSLTITKGTMEVYLREMTPRRHTPSGFL